MHTNYFKLVVEAPLSSIKGNSTGWPVARVMWLCGISYACDCAGYHTPLPVVWCSGETALFSGYHTLCYKQAPSWFDLELIKTYVKQIQKELIIFLQTMCKILGGMLAEVHSESVEVFLDTHTKQLNRECITFYFGLVFGSRFLIFIHYSKTFDLHFKEHIQNCLLSMLKKLLIVGSSAPSHLVFGILRFKTNIWHFIKAFR